MDARSSIRPESFLRHVNPDGGLPYAPGMVSFSEPALLMILAFIAAGKAPAAQPLLDWVLKNRNADGSIGLNREFPREGLWNTAHLAIAMHHLGRVEERDSAVEFILSSRSIPLPRSPENPIDTRLIGWPWAARTFGWVEPTAWALLALRLAGKDRDPRAEEGYRLLEDRCLPEGGWNYGNKVIYGSALIPFWDTTALAVMALDEGRKSLIEVNLALLEKSLPEVSSLYSSALVCLCLERFGRRADGLRTRIGEMLSDQKDEDLNLAHAAVGLIAVSKKRVLTP